MSADQQETRPDAPTGPERTDKALLSLLVCPLTRTSLDYDEAAQELISRAARLAYPIRNGIPYLVASEARHLDDAGRQRDR